MGLSTHAKFRKRDQTKKYMISTLTVSVDTERPIHAVPDALINHMNEKKRPESGLHWRIEADSSMVSPV